MAYATVEDVEKGFRDLDADEKEKCEALIEEAEVMIDQTSTTVTDDVKRIVVCRMVKRAIGNGDSDIAPIGSTQGSQSALGYSTSWTMTSGSVGELYFSKTDKLLLGLGNRIGATNPFGGCND